TLAARIAAAGESGGEAASAGKAPIPRRPPGGAPPLSFAQERLWLVDQISPGSAAYNLPGALLLRGTLDRQVFGATFAEVVRGHRGPGRRPPLPRGGGRRGGCPGRRLGRPGGPGGTPPCRSSIWPPSPRARAGPRRTA